MSLSSRKEAKNYWNDVRSERNLIKMKDRRTGKAHGLFCLLGAISHQL